MTISVFSLNLLLLRWLFALFPHFLRRHKTWKQVANKQILVDRLAGPKKSSEPPAEVPDAQVEVAVEGTEEPK